MITSQTHLTSNPSKIRYSKKSLIIQPNQHKNQRLKAKSSKKFQKISKKPLIPSQKSLRLFQNQKPNQKTPPVARFKFRSKKMFKNRSEI